LEAVLQLEKTAQERLFGNSERRHVRGALTSAEHSAQRDHQQLVEIMETGVAGPRVIKSFPSCHKPIQRTLPGLFLKPTGRLDPVRIGQ
jgi:hypothetical protein